MGDFRTRIIGLDPERIAALRDSPLARDTLAIVTTTLAREAELLLALDLDELAGGVTVPTLFLLGDRSPRWAATTTETLLPTLPGATVATLPGCDHDAVDDAPELVAAVLHTFFEDLTDRPA